jgi:hypothetical protein
LSNEGKEFLVAGNGSDRAAQVRKAIHSLTLTAFSFVTAYPENAWFKFLARNDAPETELPT